MKQTPVLNHALIRAYVLALFVGLFHDEVSLCDKGSFNTTKSATAMSKPPVKGSRPKFQEIGPTVLDFGGALDYEPMNFLFMSETWV